MPSPPRRRPSRGAIALGLLAALALTLPFTPGPRADEELVDLTLLFHSAVKGKIEPCG